MNADFVLLSLAAILCALLYALFYDGNDEETKANRDRAREQLARTLIRIGKDEPVRPTGILRARILHPR